MPRQILPTLTSWQNQWRAAQQHRTTSAPEGVSMCLSGTPTIVTQGSLVIESMVVMGQRRGTPMRHRASPCEVVQCGNGSLTELAPWPSSWSSLEAPTARLDSRGCQVDRRLRLRVEGAGRYSSNSLPQLPAVERLPRAKNEVSWILGPQTPSGGRRGALPGCSNEVPGG